MYDKKRKKNARALTLPFIFSRFFSIKTKLDFGPHRWLFFRRLFFLYLFYTTFPYGNDFPNFRSFPLSVCSKLDFLSRENRACLTGRCHFAARDAHSHHVWNLLLQILLFLPYVHYHFDVQRPVNSANRMFVSLATYYNL